MSSLRVVVKLLVLLWATFLSSGCTQYMIGTNFHMLQRGMTKAEFMHAWGEPAQKKFGVGGNPAASRTFRVGADIWEVWVYNIYNANSIINDNPFVDHREHVAFKNGLLEEWGPGTIPITLRENPNRIDVHMR
jgi:hypothetical protein